MLTFLVLAAALSLDATATAQHLTLRLDPAAHELRASAVFEVAGVGPMVFRLNDRIEVSAVYADGQESLFMREPDPAHGVGTLTVHLQGGERALRILFHGTLREEVEAGERPGAIHNFSVNAHIGPDGVFLSDGSAWHPQWIAERDGVPHLLPASITIEPIAGWAFVASGDPVDAAEDLSQPVWRWRTPRGVDGVALAGGRHQLHGERAEFADQTVEIIAMFSSERAVLAPLFVTAAREYLELYTPLLGAFPFARFTIVENFFSSGFAFPGFTLLGPQVVVMGPRALGYGYLDHELLHNWWGNGVYVNPADGNWAEALTTYSANYYRRIADGGEEAGLAWRRDTLMRLATDPETFDNAPLDRFGRERGVHRFVGYDKGAFVFTMLEHGDGLPMEDIDRAAMWRALRRFADEHMGRRAGWDDLRAAFEAEFGASRERFFEIWVRGHVVPVTPNPYVANEFETFMAGYSGTEWVDAALGADRERGRWREIDPDFRGYRVLPPWQIIPTIAGTFGPGGVRIDGPDDRDEFTAYARTVNGAREDGENLLLIGRDAFDRHADLIARASNALRLDDEGAVTIAGQTLTPETSGAAPSRTPEAILHTMPHPDRPGRFITLFLPLKESGWSRLRLIGFYTRDTTVQWVDGRVDARGLFEPSRRWYQNDHAPRPGE